MLIAFGILSDAFIVEIVLDEQAKTTRYTLLKDKESLLFDTSKPLTGHILVSPTSGSKTWHYGIKLQLESNAAYFESFHCESLIVLEQEIASEGYISEKTKYSFEFNLSNTIQNSEVLENYVGELFVLNHSLILTILRPWYSFDTINHKFIAFQSIKNTPNNENDLKNLNIYKVLSENNSDFKLENEIILTDFSSGICKLKYNKTYYNIEEKFNSELTLSIKIQKNEKNENENVEKNENEEKFKNLELKLIFYKIETGDEDENEVIINEIILDTFINEFNTLLLKNKEINEKKEEISLTKNINFDLTEFPFKKSNNSEIELENDPLSPNFLSPTFYQKEFGEVPLGVRYYIRLMLSDNTKEHWNTNEIILFRSKFEGRCSVKTLENV